MTIVRVPVKHRRKPRSPKPSPGGVVAGIEVLTRLCPVCGATAGKPCRIQHPNGTKGKTRSAPHDARATNTDDPGPLPKKDRQPSKTPKAGSASKPTTAKQGRKKPADPVLEELRARQSRLRKIRVQAQANGQTLPKVTAAEQRFRADYAAWMRERAHTPGTPEHQRRQEQSEIDRALDAVHQTVYGGDINTMTADDW